MKIGHGTSVTLLVGLLGLAGGCDGSDWDGGPPGGHAGIGRAPDPSDLLALDPCVTSPAADGCAVTTLVRHPDVIFGPARAELAAARAGLGSEPGSAPAARAYAAAEKAEAASAQAYLTGDFCRAAVLSERALAEADEAQRALSFRAHEAMKTFALGHGAGKGFAPDAQPAMAEPKTPFHAEIAALRSTSAVAALRKGSAAVTRMCAARGAPFETTGVIAQVDDAAGQIVLEDGSALVMPPAAPGAEVAQPGRKVRIKGVRAGDGVAVANLIAPVAGGPVVAKSGGGATTCLELRIVPVQNPALSLAHPFLVDHPLKGYGDFSPVPAQLLLEDGMGFTVLDDKCTISAGPPSSYNKYSARISLQQTGGPLITLASSLTAGQYAYLPALAGTSAQVYAMEFEGFKQTCSHPQIGNDTCAAPVSLATFSYAVTEWPTGSLAAASYDITKNGIAAVNVAHNGVADDSAPVKVTGYQWSVLPPGGAALTGFAAEGYVDGANGPTIASVGTNQAFLIREDDFSSPYSDPANMPPFSQRMGQVQPGGLRWARVVGKRNNNPFWYTATTPRVIRDRIAACPGLAEDTYYEVPYSKASSARGLGLGNWDDPNPHGSNQIYAYDFLAVSTGVKVLAARGGTVVWFDDSFPDKAAGGDPNPFPCGGNFIYIRDQAGTFAVYYHEKQGKISPYIAQGDIVARGQPIGQTGLSGCTSAPHVHFEAVSAQVSDYGSLPSRFHLKVWDVASSTFNSKSCHVVRSTETYLSTNVLHVH